MAKPVPIRFRTAEEFQTRPAWRDGLDPTQHKLAEIIGDYSFARRDALACGLKGCRTIHQKGYVVATVDGLETHIGNHCGKRYFNVNWGEIQAEFQRAVEERDIQEWLSSMLTQRDTLLTNARRLLSELYEKNARISEIRDKLSKDRQLLLTVEQVARDGGVIREEREMDEAIANARNVPERQRRYFETVGRIVRADVLIPADGSARLPGQLASDYLRQQVIPDIESLTQENLAKLNVREQKQKTRALEFIDRSRAASSFWRKRASF